jgi:energy-coupling factor transporter ATP-binding protein EcfA2
MLPNPTNLGQANTALIRYPRFNELHQEIRMCQEISRMAGEPQCMSLEGVTGAGKSTLVRLYAEAFPRSYTAEGVKIPIFYMETPSPVTVKGMAARMLTELGDPAAHSGPLWSMNDRLIHYIGQACQVQLVILDDFHHLIDQETNRILEKVSDWLKVLIKETNVPFLVVGMAGKVEPILKANDQLSRLFAAREQLAPFSWDGTDKKSLRDFAAFIKYGEKGLGLPLSEEIPRQELLYRLHYATDGVVGNVMNLLRFATFLAQRQGTTQLSLTILSQAFAKRLQKHMAKRLNPFAVAADQLFIPPQPAPPSDPPDSTPKRSRRLKANQPSVTDVLKTS